MEFGSGGGTGTSTSQQSAPGTVIWILVRLLLTWEGGDDVGYVCIMTATASQVMLKSGRKSPLLRSY